MAISPYIRDLRDKVGHDLLVLPSVAVLPCDREGRILLVQSVETGSWQTIGGAVEPDESPRDAAWREAVEEAGVALELGAVLEVLGGADYRVTYPNGDVVSYVVVVFDAIVVSGTPRPDGDETCDAAWWTLDELGGAPMGELTVSLLRSVYGNKFTPWAT